MTSKTVVGKFTLESLTTGMYSDSKVIFREYVQNSTDAIDKAIQLNLFKNRNEGRIDIELNLKANKIVICDNGCGVKNSEVWNTLCDIGKSKKSYLENRGFRGIGRLGGLSYCERLIFETSYYGESIKSIVTWDSKKLRELLRPGIHEELDLVSAIESVASVETKQESEAEHYFKVTLEKISDSELMLLDDKVVSDYLRQVAPIPFHTHYFYFYHDSHGIKAELQRIGKPLEEYNIHINKDPVPLYKPYNKRVLAGKKEDDKQLKDSVLRINYIEERNEKGDLIFWGWYAITNFLGYIKDELVSGIRVRKNNILIGDSSTLNEFFTQDRFNSWHIGEIHVYDDNIIPNARRDHFEKNKEYYIFKERVEKYSKGILSKYPVQYSEYNSTIKKIESANKELEEINRRVLDGYASEIEKEKDHKTRDRLYSTINKCSDTLRKIESRIERTDKNVFAKKDELDKRIRNTDDLIDKFKNIENKITDAPINKSETRDSLSSYNKITRKVIYRIIDVLYRELPSDDAKKIKDAIIEELSRKKN